MPPWPSAACECGDLVKNLIDGRDTLEKAWG